MCIRDRNQAVIVVLFFNLIDTTVQFFFRSLYTFRPILIKGDFDFDLLKPLPTFFRPLLSGPDFLDLPLIIIKLTAFIYFIVHYSIAVNTLQIVLVIFLFINAFILAFAVHLAIAAWSILTTEIDNLVSMYRSLGQAAIIPTDIYHGVLRFALDYIIPFTVIATIPAKAILGILSPSGIIFSCLVTYGFLFSSIKLWRYSLRHYTSASS
jgi:ABC-2 type transport system permease protein